MTGAHVAILKPAETRKKEPWIPLALLAAAFSVGIWFASDGLDLYPRLVFITFVLAAFVWTFTSIDSTYVALGAALLCAVAAGPERANVHLDALGSELIWLLLAAFVVSAAVSASGLSARVAAALTGRARSTSQLFYTLAAGLLASAFVIPSTAARAALMVPVFLTLGQRIDNPRILRALALLLPSVILLSSVGSLVGAGGNILAVEILNRMTGARIGFFEWLVLGLPFALVSCFGSTWIILHLFLTPGERRQRLMPGAGTAAAPIEAAASRHRPFGAQEGYVAGVVAVLVLLWITEPFHGVSGALVALAGALAVTLPRLGPISLKDGLKGVEWSLLLFLAASLEIGHALIESGGAELLVARSLAAAPGNPAVTPLLVVAAVALIALLAHLVINSRTARSAVLIPPVIMLGSSVGLNPAALAFLAAAAAGFCLTLTVSAKPVLIFSQLNGGTFRQRDLLRLSGVLLPFHFLALLLFAFLVWPMLGLPLQEGVATSSAAP